MRKLFRINKALLFCLLIDIGECSTPGFTQVTDYNSFKTWAETVPQGDEVLNCELIGNIQWPSVWSGSAPIVVSEKHHIWRYEDPTATLDFNDHKNCLVLNHLSVHQIGFSP